MYGMRGRMIMSVPICGEAYVEKTEVVFLRGINANFQLYKAVYRGHNHLYSLTPPQNYSCEIMTFPLSVILML